MTAYLTVMRRYATFQGRASRAEFWWFSLVLFGLTIVAAVLDASLGTGDPRSGLFVGLVQLVHALPGLAVSVRRLHDLDRTGWWVLLALTGIGGLVLLVFYASAGTPGPNRFGAPVTGSGAVTPPMPDGVADPTPATAQATRDPIAEVERLARLRAAGSLSEAEFATLKARALAGPGNG